MGTTHAGTALSSLVTTRSAGPPLRPQDLYAVGHRVVHGGDLFRSPAVVDDAVIDAIQDLVPLAPLHNPGNLAGIRAARAAFPTTPQVAVFDTAFHQTLPPHAFTYAVPREWRERHRVRRYGFHGTSHAYVSRRLATLLGRDVSETNVVVLHLGNGASAAAVAGGACIDTSMGLSPLEGLVMGTRPGDLDPALPSHLAREGVPIEDYDRALNAGSGLRGLTGTNDFREVERLVEAGDPAAALALDIVSYRIAKYVGSYAVALGRLDGIAFTAGIGEHSPRLRAEVLARLGLLGIRVDPDRNAGGPSVAKASRTTRIAAWWSGASTSRVVASPETVCRATAFASGSPIRSTTPEAETVPESASRSWYLSEDEPALRTRTRALIGRLPGSP